MVAPPLIVATKSKLNAPTNNQFKPPTINKIKAILSRYFIFNTPSKFDKPRVTRLFFIYENNDSGKKLFSIIFLNHFFIIKNFMIQLKSRQKQSHYL